MADKPDESYAQTDTPPTEGCLLEIPSDPCTMVILGASGDLTSRKLIPELFSLYQKGGMPERFQIVGCARSPMTTEQFRTRLAEAVNDTTDETGTHTSNGTPEKRARKLTPALVILRLCAAE